MCDGDKEGFKAQQARIGNWQCDGAIGSEVTVKMTWMTGHLVRLSTGEMPLSPCGRVGECAKF